MIENITDRCNGSLFLRFKHREARARLTSTNALQLGCERVDGSTGIPTIPTGVSGSAPTSSPVMLTARTSAGSTSAAGIRLITFNIKHYSGTDFGVNFTIDPNNKSHALLRGYAYGANIGWISFEAIWATPTLSSPTGNWSGLRLRGKNMGWTSTLGMALSLSRSTTSTQVSTEMDGRFAGRLGITPTLDATVST